MDKLQILEQMILGESNHLEAKHRLKQIASADEFRDLLSRTMLTDDEKAILEMIYIKGKDFRYIGDTLGFSESTVKRKHHKAVEQLNKML